MHGAGSDALNADDGSRQEAFDLDAPLEAGLWGIVVGSLRPTLTDGG
jgi:hypothetical protein